MILGRRHGAQWLNEDIPAGLVITLSVCITKGHKVVLVPLPLILSVTQSADMHLLCINYILGCRSGYWGSKEPQKPLDMISYLKVLRGTIEG